MLYVRVLGELELETDDGPIELPARAPARLLLAWLALHPGRHARSEVAGTLWPNVREDSARTSLRSALAALRAAMGAGRRWRPRASTWDWPARSVRVDALEFERRLPRDPSGALALSRGPLLAGIDEDWVLRARDAQLEREADALRALAEQADPATALALLRRRAALDPLAEPAHRDLMRRLVRGRRPRRRARRLRAARRTAAAPARRRAVDGHTRARRRTACRSSSGRESAAPRAFRRGSPPSAVVARSPVAITSSLAALWRRRSRRALRRAPDRRARASARRGCSPSSARRCTDEGVVVLYGRADEDVLEPYRARGRQPADHAQISALWRARAARPRWPSDVDEVGARSTPWPADDRWRCCWTICTGRTPPRHGCSAGSRPSPAQRPSYWSSPIARPTSTAAIHSPPSSPSCGVSCRPSTSRCAGWTATPSRDRRRRA